MFRSTVLVCGGTGCHSNHSGEIYDAFQKQIAENKLSEEVMLVKTGCFGLCAVGPVVIIYPEGSFYSHVTVDDVPELISEHLIKGRPVRGIVADCTGKSRAFFDKSLAFAQDIGLGGLGYLTLKQGEYKGPIAKFLNEAQQQQLRDLTGIKEGETVFFVCAGAKVVDGLSGQIRTWLGKELELIDNDAIEFCFVVDFPMYTYNNEEKKIDFMHNPFSMPQGGMKALEGDPLEALAYQYDLVCNGVEVSSGAVRNHDPEIMRKAFAIAGYSEDELKAKFSALYTAFSYGAPPHAGMAPGVERLLMLLTDATSIREVMAFPLNSSAQDAMVGAPSGVTEQQLREVHIKVRD